MSSNLFPELADVGAAPIVVVAEAHASEGEEETDSHPLQKKPRTVKFTTPPKTQKLGKYAQPSILISCTLYHKHTTAPSYGYDPKGEPTRTEVRPSEHFSHGQ